MISKRNFCKPSKISSNQRQIKTKKAQWWKITNKKSQIFRILNNRVKKSLISSQNRERWLRESSWLRLITARFNTKKLLLIYTDKLNKFETWIKNWLLNSENRQEISRSEAKAYLTLSLIGTTVASAMGSFQSSKKTIFKSHSQFKPSQFPWYCLAEM